MRIINSILLFFFASTFCYSQINYDDIDHDTLYISYGDTNYMEKIAPVGEKYRLKSKVPYKEGVVIINFTASDRVIISHVEDSLLNGPYFDYDSTYYKYGSYLNGEQYGIFVEKLLIEDEWYYNINHFEGYDQKYIQVEW